jgi:hypothetical protein
MDLELLETGNGGDLVKKVRDLSVISGFQNMAYLALFGGNPNHSTPVNRLSNTQDFSWWGNNLLFKEKPEFQFNSLTESVLMNVALNSSGAAKIEQAVKKDLEFMKKFADLTISVSILSDTRCEISVKINQPENEQNKDFVFVWDSTQKELPSSEKRIIVKLFAPSNFVFSNILDTSFSVSATSNSGSLEYGFEWEVSDDSDFNNIVFSGSTGINTPSFNVTGAIADTTYYVRIRAYGETVSTWLEGSTKTLFAFTFSSKATAAAVFAISITYGGADTPKWIMPNAVTVNSASVSAVGSTYGFNSTSKSVKLLISDKTAITAFVGTSTSKLDGALNFSTFVGATFSNINMGSTGTVTSINASVINYTNGFTISAQSHPVVTLVTNISSTAIVGTINMLNGDVTAWNRGNLVFTNSTIDFTNCALSSFTLTASDTFTKLALAGNSLTTLANLSSVDFTSATSYLDLSSNTSLNFTLPSSISGKFQELRFTNCSKTGTIDLDAYDYAATSFIRISNNSGITSITYPIMTTGSIREIDVSFLSLTGYQDISGIIGNAGIINVFMNNNSGLTGVSDLANDGTCYRGFTSLSNCNLTGSLNWSSYLFIGGAAIDIDLSVNPLLTSLTLNTVTPALRSLKVNGCALTTFNVSLIGSGALDRTSASFNIQNNGASAAQVATYLANLNTISGSGFTRSSNMAGTNAAPTGGSGNADYLALVGKGWVITITP